MKLLLPALLGLAFVCPSFGADSKIDAAIARGVQWLRQQQKENGSFANPANETASTEHPALTALPLLALDGAGGDKTALLPALRRGYAYLRSQAQPDGGIYGKGLANYNTSVCLMALLRSGDPQDEKVIEAAHAFVAGQQAKDLPDPVMNGGFGYGPISVSASHPHPDLDNTLLALEALAAYKKARPTSEHANDLDWKAAIDFVSRCQNLPETNSQAWVNGDAENKGGFVYFPGVSRAPDVTRPDGSKALRSYGTMSYAGLLSFIYADLKRDDPRVTAALEWLRKNYSDAENPGLGRQGLYYYYHLATTGLNAAGVKELTTANGKVNWRSDLGEKIAALQSADGSWVNDNARWMETDPVLVTSYCVLALETIRGGE